MSRLYDAEPARGNNAVRLELEQIRLANPQKELRPEDVVAFARRNRNSALGKIYPRNEARAAHQFRLEWARAVIRVNVTVVHPESRNTNVTVVVKEYQSLPNSRGDEGGYVPTRVVMQNKAKRHELLLYTLQRLESVTETLLFPDELGEVIRAISRARSRYPVPERKKAA